MALSLTTETWGEQLHRAYRRGKDQYGFTYRSVRDLLRPFIEVSDQTIIRLEELDHEPASIQSRRIAYLVLTAYGYAPEEWGFTPENCALTGLDMKKVRRAITPGHGSSKRTIHGGGLADRLAA